MKTLNEKLAVLAEWMGYTLYSNDAFVIPASMHHIKIKDIPQYHTSFDALWPPLMKFINWPMNSSIEDMGITEDQLTHAMYSTRIKEALLSSDTPAPAFELLVEGVEWLNSVNTESKQ